MIQDNSLKEYYIRLNTLYENAVNILTALNQSLVATSTEVKVNLIDESGTTETQVSIPSVLNIQSKIEELDIALKSLINIPESGEAWFQNDGNIYKLQMCKSNTAPQVPEISGSLNAYTIDNNFLKDLVSPKTYLKLNISNLTYNIDSIFMKKIVIYDESTFNGLKAMNLESYEDYVSALYNYTKGIDYDEYDSTLDLPLRKSRYKSKFSVIGLTDLSTSTGNPWYDDSTGKYNYEIVLDTLTYVDSEDSSIEYTLKVGDRICLPDQLAVYEVKSRNIADNSVWIEEVVGHQNIDDSSAMYFEIYDTDYSEYDYVLIPLEENQYIAVFIATISNNVRSLLSSPILVDLSTIYMYDQYGNKIKKSNGEFMNYMDYYNTYCNNLGDLILGLSETAYPLISNYTTTELYNLLNDDAIKQLVYDTITANENIQVVPTNKYMVDDTTNQEIIQLHALKNELNSQLTSIQTNIDSTYNTLINTDFTADTTVSQIDLQAKLTSYYTEKTTITKQLIATVLNINTKLQDSSVNTKTEYAIRGISSISDLETYLSNYYNNVHVIGLDIEYKYKSPTKDTTNVTIIDNNTFTDWNKQYNIDRQRKVTVDTATNILKVDFESYLATDNIVKWNQIDIPIQQGEDVVIRARYKYNVGQPFVNIYSPWSENIEMSFPDNYAEDLEVVDIAKQNLEDSIDANTNSILINDGYTDHVNDRIINGDKTFFHDAENIYSGFNSSTNTLISLKDKLTTMVNLISNLEQEISKVTNSKFTVYLAYDDMKVELFPNQINKINLTNNDSTVNNYTRKDMNIVITNTGDTPIYFYSIFPGNINIPLLMTENEYYNNYIGNYQSVPVFANDTIQPQVLGQWIYFRSHNPYTKKPIYVINKSTSWSKNPSLYIRKDFNQAAFAYRNRTIDDIEKLQNQYWNTIYKDLSGVVNIYRYGESNQITSIDWDSITIDDAMYANGKSKFINRFEDIYYVTDDSQQVYLDSKSDITDFSTSFSDNISNTKISSQFSSLSNYNGAFFFANLNAMSQILTNGDIQDKLTINVGESISLPICFEYFLNGAVKDLQSITKGLYFDLKNSLFLDPKHYMIEVTAKYDIDYTNYNYTNIADTLIDLASTLN